MKNNPFKIGITGGIGSGKSLVCKIFSKLGVPIYDADSRAKWLTNNDSSVKNAVIEAFGKESYLPDGLNRNYISKIVFDDKSKLEQLNSIVHPAVGQDFTNWCNQQTTSYIIKEAALMFESGSYKALDRVINVSAPKALRVERVLKRDDFRTREQIESIIDKQLTEEERQERSDYLIYNDGQQMVIPQVLKLHEEFNQLAL